MNFGTVTTKRDGKHVTIKVTCQSNADAEGFEDEGRSFAEHKLRQFAAKRPHEWNEQGACPLCHQLDDATIHRVR